MVSYQTERSPINLKPAIDQLIKGRDLAERLRVLLQGEALVDVQSDSLTRDLTRDLMRTFSNAIAALDERDKCSQRGGYRRRRFDPRSCTRKVAVTLEDGNSWRKYGQKEIQNAKFSRSYFRCTHKSDQGCVATRQVQRSEEDPSMFVITYFGEHTCRDPAVVLSSCLQGDSCLLDFASNAKAVASGGGGGGGGGNQVSKRGGEIVSHHPTPGSSPSGSSFELTELGMLEGSARIIQDFGGWKDHGGVTSELQPSIDDLDWDFQYFSEFSDLLGLEMVDL